MRKNACYSSHNESQDDKYLLDFLLISALSRFAKNSEINIDLIEAQDWLEQNYPWEKRENIQKIDINKCNLEGSLKLEGFTNLKELHCSDNWIISLDVSNCPNLKVLDCSDNMLTHLELSQNSELEELSICNNFFLSQELSFLSHLVNLRYLFLGNYNEQKINRGIYNRFFGSLEPLKNMNRLELLEIINTDLDSGLEYLPESIKHLMVDKDKRKDAKCKIFYNLFANDQGVVEVDELGAIKNFSQKFSLIKARSLLKDELHTWKGQVQQLENQLNQANRKIIELDSALFAERERTIQNEEWRKKQLKDLAEQKDRQIRQLQIQLNQEQVAKIENNSKKNWFKPWKK